MDRKALIAALSAILTTALECQPCPESMAYIALGSDMQKWEQVRDVMISAKLATFPGHSITLTEKGTNQCGSRQVGLAGKEDIQHTEGAD